MLFFMRLDITHSRSENEKEGCQEKKSTTPSDNLSHNDAPFLSSALFVRPHLIRYARSEPLVVVVAGTCIDGRFGVNVFTPHHVLVFHPGCRAYSYFRPPDAVKVISGINSDHRLGSGGTPSGA